MAYTKERTEAEMAVYDFLERENIEYERVDHEPAHTMEICAGIEKKTRCPDLQESVSMQPSADRFLSADDTCR